MGFLEEMGKQLGNVVSGATGSGGQPDVLQLAQALMAQNGGVEGVLAKLQQGGLGDVVKSWLGNGQNLPISAEQIASVFGNPQIAAVASQFGIDPQQVTSQLAQHLPGLVDKLSPGGAISGNPQDLLAQGASLLKGFLK